ncbi:hypothetical protein Vretimale_19464 [Volvox reticuliferus]|uniref:Uncharacterized protein n=1 Tax=Volvox reticuliferus TaxID=1737510 RepID=A0A8J4D0S7_9CHLO|nr:hypothetical protein Vretifemale_20158 [Volvox reticuliferus]GIM16894.1 hypothetical protein Vretimale_19464 [Volvox reticuliferus]
MEMANMAATSLLKKRVASDTTASVCQLSKKPAKDATWPAAGPMTGVPGWQYPPLPMGMIPPVPYCMPGNPFFPFMGMFPPFWLPAAAMAAATMPALAAASAANVGMSAAVPGISGAAVLQSNTPAMWPMMPCTAAVQPIPGATAPTQVTTCTSSGVSSAAAIPSTSCTNSVPTVGVVQSPPSPLPLAASPVSVCNSGLQQQPEDLEFANFIDSFLLSEDGEDVLRGSSGDIAGPQIADLLSSGGSNSSDATTDEGASLPRCDSLCLLSLLGPDDIGLPDL